MTLEEVQFVKRKMSPDVLSSKKKMARIFSMAGSSDNVSTRSISIRESLRENVNGIGISQDANKEYLIKLFARNKLTVNKKNLSKFYDVDPRFIVVKDFGSITFWNNRSEHRPLCPGVSIGHYAITAGTLGCLVKDKSNNVYLLSNNHVLANCNNCKADDNILQPGSSDGGEVSRHVVAKLADYIKLDTTKPNKIDAAIAKIVDGISYVNKLSENSSAINTKSPALGMPVEKNGRTTGVRRGVIITTQLDLQVDYDGKIYDFEDQFEISGNYHRFSKRGDSGSLIIEQGTNNAIGLLFAGFDGSTFACPIDTVLSAFDVSII